MADHKQKRAWQRMLSGRRLDLLDPSPLDVEIEDIAHGLARVARWNGQTIGAYAFSVAQHSILVMKIIEAKEPDMSHETMLAALLHDAPEYVMGDIISPFKSAMGGDYKALENRLLAAIHIRFDLPVSLSQKTARLLKQADKTAAFYEATYLAGFSEDEGRKFFGGPMVSSEAIDDFQTLITPWSVEISQAHFIHYHSHYLNKKTQVNLNKEHK